MINLIKADLYRLFKSKCYKNCIIASIVTAILTVCIPIILGGPLWIMSFTSSGSEIYGFRIGAIQYNGEYLSFIINALGTAIFIYLIGIILVINSSVKRFSSGTLKNTVSYGYERWKIYLSNLVSIIVGVSILSLISFLITLILPVLTYKPLDFELNSIIITIKYLIEYIVILASMISIYYFCTVLIPDSSVISCIVILEFCLLTVISSSLPEKITRFIPFSMIRKFTAIPDKFDFIYIFFNSAVLIIISTIIGILVFRRKEIK